MSSSVHVENKRKDNLILDEGVTQGLDDTILTAEAKYLINFTQPGEKFVLSLHYNGSNSFLIFNATNVYKSKQKNTGRKEYGICLGSISKDFIINDIKKTGLKGVVNPISVDFNTINTNDILNIHKYLIKRT